MSLRDELASKAVERYLRISSVPKKQMEVALAGELLRRHGLPHFVLNEEKGPNQEEPDIIVSIDGRNVIGIEITELYAKGKADRHHNVWHAWCGFAKMLRLTLTESGYPFLYGVLHPKVQYGYLPKASVWPTMCREVVHLASLIKDQRESITLPRMDSPVLLSFATGVSFISTEPEPDIFWWRSDLQSGYLTTSIEDIRSLVSMKRAKASTHYDCKAVSERWLLIYARGHGLADRMPFQLSELDVEISPFTTLSLWNWWSDTLHTIRG